MVGLPEVILVILVILVMAKIIVEVYRLKKASTARGGISTPL
jgi:hypothetical protein